MGESRSTKFDIEKFYIYIFKGKTVLIKLLILVTVLFHVAIENFISSAIVDGFADGVPSTWYADAAILILGAYAALYYKSRKRPYLPSKTILVVLGLLSIMYSIYRWGHPVWNFTPFSFSSSIYYADIIFVVTGFNFLLLTKSEKASKRGEKEDDCNKESDASNVEESDSVKEESDRKEEKDPIPSFLSDQSLGKCGKDELGYSDYAKSLTNFILTSDHENSFAIGINGEWGIGKTSFLDLVKRNFDGKDQIEIDFNPWRSNNPKGIIEDFFETIQDALRPYNSSLARSLISYSNKLASLKDNSVAQVMKAAVSGMFGVTTLNQMYDDVNKAIKATNRKIIIYIDDLDRLDKEEVVEVLKLIRNTANFYNTVFIVAYDRAYLVESIKSYNEHKPERFLEKIFNLEISMPYFDKDKLKDKLENLLKENFKEVYPKMLLDQGTNIDDRGLDYVDGWLESMRDVKRLVNSLILNLNNVKIEVVYHEFLRIELLRLKYASAHKLLTREMNAIFILKNNSYGKNQYFLPGANPSPMFTTGRTVNEYENKLLEFLESDPKLNVLEVEKILKLLYTLFGLHQGVDEEDNLSIVYPSQFPKYFSYGLTDGMLSNVEFSRVRRELSQEEFYRKIDDWIEGKLESEVILRLKGIWSYDSREEFEKIIRGMFYLGAIISRKHDYELVDTMVYDLQKQIWLKLELSRNNVVEKQYNGNQSELADFVRDVLYSAKYPYAFEAGLIRERVSQPPFHDYPLNNDDLHEIVLGYFSNVTQKHENLDKMIWLMYFSTQQTEWEPTDGNSKKQVDFFPDNARSLMKEFVLTKTLDQFLQNMIWGEYRNKGYYNLKPTVLDVFFTWEEFRNELESIADPAQWKYLEEFMCFLNRYDEPDYSKSVPFVFDIIPVTSLG